MKTIAYLCGMHMLRTPSTKATTKVLKKYGQKISISNHYLRGTFTIKNFRDYNHIVEVDVEFQGDIHVNYNRKKDWFNSSVMTPNGSNGSRVSNIKVNRFIKRNMFSELKSYLMYFDVNLGYYDCIKKITWK